MKGERSESREVSLKLSANFLSKLFIIILGEKCAIQSHRPNQVIFPLYVNPLPANHDYCRFLPVLLVHQTTDIGNEMVV